MKRWKWEMLFWGFVFGSFFSDMAFHSLKLAEVFLFGAFVVLIARLIATREW